MHTRDAVPETLHLRCFIGPKLVERWGRQIVTDNRPSAGGIACSIVAEAEPDGHTLMVTAE